jgi:hypothetical protein
MRPALLVAAVAALMLVASGCDTAPEDAPLPEGVTTTRRPPPPPPTVEEVQEVEVCEDLVEVGELFVRNMVQALEAGLPVEVLTGDAPAPPEVEDLRAVGRELDERTGRLNCVVGDLNQAIVEEVADLESGEPVVALFLEIVRSGVVDLLPESVPGTTGG